MEASDFNVTDPYTKCSLRATCNDTYRIGGPVWVFNSADFGTLLSRDLLDSGTYVVGQPPYILATLWAIVLCGWATMITGWSIVRSFCDPFPLPTVGYTLQMTQLDNDSLEAADLAGGTDGSGGSTEVVVGQ